MLTLFKIEFMSLYHDLSINKLESSSPNAVPLLKSNSSMLTKNSFERQL
jgi:hypothetical protein